MKLPLMAAVAALTFWGCSSQSAATRADDTTRPGASSATGGSGADSTSSADGAWQSDPAEQIRQQREDVRDGNESPGEAGNVVDNEKRDRGGAPTVYDGEATGGSGTGTTVTTPEGEKWDVQEEPMGSEPRNESANDGTGGAGIDDKSDDKDSSTQKTGSEESH